MKKLDEAIERFSHNAEYERTHGNLQGCLEFRQLAEWLSELKKLKEQTEPITMWHTITGYNKDLSYDANRDDGVDLPEVSRDVLAIYPGIKGVYAKISSEEGMDGTSYYDGVLWAYYVKPMGVKK